MAEDREGTQLESAAEPTSLREDIAAAYDASMKDAAPKESQTESVDQAQSQDQEAPQQLQDVATALEPPEIWSADAKAAFTKAPLEVQQQLLKQEEARSADYTRKTQELAEERRKYEDYDKHVGPYVDQLALAGMTPASAFRQLMTVQKMLDSDPAGTLRWMANSYGLTFSQLAQQEQQATSGQVDPARLVQQALEKELAPIKQWMSQAQQGQQSFQDMALKRDLDAFADEKDSSGNPIRPMFNELRDHIANTLLAWEYSGNAPQGTPQEIVQAAYEQVYAPIKKARSEQITQKIQKAKQAQAAGSSISGTSGGVQSAAKPKSIRATIEQAWNEQNG